MSAWRVRRGFAIVALAGAGACDGDPYVFIGSDSARGELRAGETTALVATYARNEVFFPFSSALVVIYTSEERPGAFRWASSDTTVARVDGRGNVSARREGTVNIVARTEGVAGGEYLRVVP